MKVLKNIKRFSLIIILFLLFINLIGCKKDDNNVINNTNPDFPEEMFGKIKDKKVYLTSIGQANDLLIFDDLYKNSFDYEIDMLLTPDNIDEGSIVFIFVGCSIKALEESSLSLSEERNRANELINGSKNGKYEIIAFHLGGNSRRGSTSDSFIQMVFSSSIFNIFQATGNEDGFLANTSVDNNIPYYVVPRIGALETPLKLLLGVKGE